MLKDPYPIARKRMVEEQLVAGGVRDPRVLAVMGRLQRHRFVEPGLEDQAYLDHPLTIGQGQTISQPLIVGVMTQALELKGGESVLEVGTGCGYQTAILAELCKTVYTVERLQPLSIRARKTLYRLGYRNLHFRVGDGSEGWDEKAPFDAVLVTAAAPSVPISLQEQLKDGGRLVLPVGGEESQKLVRIRRQGKKFTTEILSDCRFVKLVGHYGWKP